MDITPSALDGRFVYTVNINCDGPMILQMLGAVGVFHVNGSIRSSCEGGVATKTLSPWGTD